MGINPSGLLLLKARSRYFALDTFTVVELCQAIADLRMDGFLAFLKQVFLVVKQLDGSPHELLHALIGAAFDVFLDELL